MSPGKRLLRSAAAQNLLARLATFYLRLIYRTTRWHVIRPESLVALHESRRPYIGCFWHSRLLLIRASLPRPERTHLLVSQHRDGALIARVVGALGAGVVSGSSRRGGFTAARAMARLLAEGQIIGLTPDGPRGPRMRAKLGPLKAAQLAGTPLVPIGAAVSRRRMLRTWDRFCLALPFGRGVILWGEPLEVPAEADADELERLRGVLEERLNALTAEADGRFGHPPVEPAAPAPAAAKREPAEHARA